jgi:hypothetical protein
VTDAPIEHIPALSGFARPYKTGVCACSPRREFGRSSSLVIETQFQGRKF